MRIIAEEKRKNVIFAKEMERSQEKEDENKRRI